MMIPLGQINLDPAMRRAMEAEVGPYTFDTTGMIFAGVIIWLLAVKGGSGPAGGLE